MFHYCIIICMVQKRHLAFFMQDFHVKHILKSKNRDFLKKMHTNIWMTYQFGKLRIWAKKWHIFFPAQIPKVLYFVHQSREVSLLYITLKKYFFLFRLRIWDWKSPWNLRSGAYIVQKPQRPNVPKPQIHYLTSQVGYSERPNKLDTRKKLVLVQCVCIEITAGTKLLTLTQLSSIELTQTHSDSLSLTLANSWILHRFGRFQTTLGCI